LDVIRTHGKTRSSVIPGTRRGDIQGVRAVAVVLVIAGHIVTYTDRAPSSWQRVEGGFIGVDVFFVLSGYLITGLLLREVHQRQSVGIAAFYMRRARRILPAAAVVLVATLIAAPYVLPAVRLPGLIGDAIASSLSVMNFRMGLSGVDYAHPVAMSPLQHYWSLAVEEQFYLAWPLLVGFVTVKFSRRLLVGILVTFVLTSVGWAVLAGHVHPHETYFSTTARTYELSLGALAAMIPTSTVPRFVKWILAPISLAGIIFAALTTSSDSLYPGYAALAPAGATAALLVAGDGTRGLYLLTARPVRFVGDLSYSLYLWHLPVIVFATFLIPAGTRWVGFLGVVLGTTFVLSWVTYTFVERPAQRARLSALRDVYVCALMWTATFLSVLAAAGLVHIISVHRVQAAESDADSWSIHHSTGATSDSAKFTSPESVTRAITGAVTSADAGAPIPNISIGVDHIANDLWQNHKPYSDCFSDSGTTWVTPCVLGDRDAARMMAVVGDSHMGMWLPALDAIGKKKHLRVMPYVKTACAPYEVRQRATNFPYADCEAFRKKTLAALEMTRPDVIIVTARGYLHMSEAGGRSVEGQWSEGVAATLTRFKNVTSNVVVLEDVPSRTERVDECLSTPSNMLDDCTSDLRSLESASNVVTARVASAHRARVVDVVPLVCELRACPAAVDGIALYADTNHLTYSWVRALVEPLGRSLPLFD
jgi:peptidoglycan/LPS O-acetylase OafA/YrhL